MASRAGKAKNNTIIPWLSAEVRSELKILRESDDFKKKSQQSILNRLEGEKKGIKHSQGSVSAPGIAK